MTQSHWILIVSLALGAFSIRLLGMLAGARIRQSRFAPLLDDLPGLIVVALVAASLADQDISVWIAAAAALAIAWASNNVIVTMIGGVASLIALQFFGFG